MRNLIRAIATLLLAALLSSMIVPVFAQDVVEPQFACTPTNISNVDLYEGFAYNEDAEVLVTASQGVVYAWDTAAMVRIQSTSQFDPSIVSIPLIDDIRYEGEWLSESDHEDLNPTVVTGGNSDVIIVLPYPSYALVAPLDVETGFIYSSFERIDWWTGTVVNMDGVIYVQWIGLLTDKRSSDVQRFATIDTINILESREEDFPENVVITVPEEVTAEVVYIYEKTEDNRTLELPWAVMIGSTGTENEYLVQSFDAIYVCREKVE